jgi:fructan beta-fructosidase
MKIKTILFGLLNLALVAGAADDLLIADFEGTNYGNWKVEGTAFGQGPAKGTLGGQMEVTGFQGKGLVNTFLGGDGPTGKLTSSEFTLERNYITFLIGGGGYKGKTCMNLLVEGEVVLSATGPNTEPGGSEFLNWENWDVKQYKGRKVVLQIVDAASGGWGHINLDQISQRDAGEEGCRAAPARRADSGIEERPRTCHHRQVSALPRFEPGTARADDNQRWRPARPQS